MASFGMKKYSVISGEGGEKSRSSSVIMWCNNLKGEGGAIEPHYHGLNRVLRNAELAVRYKGEAVAFLEHCSMEA